MRLERSIPMALWLTVAGWGSAGCPSARAADEPAAAVAALEEVVVSARRRDEDLQRTPVSVIALSADALEARSVVELSDVSNFVPNVTIAPDLAVGNAASSVFIRGVGQTDYRMFSDPAVAMYVDGVFIPRSIGGLMDLLDLERIEVLRGPQGTLYGKNTVAGAINLVSVRPQETFGASVELTAGAYSRYEARGMMNLPLGNGFALRTSGLVRSFEGWGRIVNDVDLNGRRNSSSNRPNEDLQAGRVQLGWRSAGSLEALLAVDSSRMRSGGAARHAFGVGQRSLAALYNQLVTTNGLALPLHNADLVPGNPYAKTANFSEATDLDVVGAALTLDWTIGSLALKSITSYREMCSIINMDVDSTLAQIWEQAEYNEQEQLGQELQVSGEALSGRLKWLAGLFYFSEKGLRDLVTQQLRQLVDLGLYPATPTQLTSTEIESDSYAAYSQATYQITDPLSLTVGVRWTREEKELGLNRINGYGINPVQGITGFNSGSWSDVSPRLGLEYQWNPDLMTYVSAAQGFKSGGFNGRPSPLLPNNGLVPYEPEELTTYELGLRSGWLENSLRVNATAFFSDYSDIQTTSTQVINGVVTVVVGNAAAAEIKGLEVELLAAIGRSWRFDASAGYVDAEYTDISGAATLFLNNVSGTGASVPDGADSVFPLSPKLSYNIGGQYTLPVPSTDGTLTMRIDVSHQQEMSPDTNPDRADGVTGVLLAQSELLDSRTLANVRVSYSSQDERWTLAAYVTNVFDERYRVTAADFNTGFGFEQFGPPRQWGVSARVGF